MLDKFDFTTQIDRLDRSGLLYLVMSKFAEIDLHPDQVSNLEMGYLYEELIWRFSELSNETAGEHFTPREVIRLMVNLLFIEDTDLLTKPGAIKTIYDGACGTGGMLSVAEDRLRELNRPYCSASDLVGEGRHPGSVEYVEQLRERPRGSPVGRRLSGEPSDDHPRCEVKQIEEKGVGVYNLESKRLDAVIRKVAGVEGDNRTSVGSHRSGEDVTVLGSQDSPSWSAW